MPAFSAFPIDPGALDRPLSDEREQRNHYIRAAWRYYRGEHRRPLKVYEGEPDDNIILNLCKQLVNSSVAMLVGRGIRFEIVEGEDTPAEDALREFWTANRKQLFLSQLATIGAVTGQPTIQFALPRDTHDPPLRLVLTDPSLLSILWAPDDMDRVLGYVLQWKVDDTEYRQDIIAPGQIENAQWLIRRLRRSPGAEWTVMETTPWPYDWPPILTWQNLPNPLRVYGLSDLEAAPLNDSVNMVASNTNRILRFHAHPRTIGVGVMAADVESTAIDNFWAIPNPEAKVFNLEMQSDLGSSMRFLDFLRAAFFSESAGVDVTIFKDKIGQITNFGLRVLFQDALDRLELKRASYGEAFIEVNRRALEVLGYGDNIRTRIHWPEPLPVDRGALAQLVNMELAGGLVSKETASTELGHDWKVEQERLRAEAREEDNLGTLLVKAFHAGQTGVPGRGGES